MEEDESREFLVGHHKKNVEERQLSSMDGGLNRIHLVPTCKSCQTDGSGCGNKQCKCCQNTDTVLELGVLDKESIDNDGRQDGQSSTNEDECKDLIEKETASNEHSSPVSKRSDNVDGLPGGGGSQGRDSPDLASLNRHNGSLSKRFNKIKTWPPRYGIEEFIFAVLAVIVFVADIGSDIKLMMEYYFTRRLDLFWLTFGFISTPSLVSGVVSVMWTYIDRQRCACLTKQEKLIIALRVIFTFVQLGRVFRYAEFLYHIIILRWMKESKENKGVRSLKAIEQKRDAVILGLMDGFLESILQLMLQLSLAIIFSLPMDAFRVFTISTSWLSASLTMTSYYRTIRRADEHVSNVNYKASVVYYLWRVFELGPRILLLALGVAFLRPWIFVGVSIHFLTVFVMYVIMNPELKGVCVSWMKYPFLFFISFVNIFCFLNLKHGGTLRRVIVFYVLYYIENYVLMGLIIWFSQDECMSCPSYLWRHSAFALVPGMVLHFLFQSLYYGVFHPNKKTNALVKCCYTSKKSQNQSAETEQSNHPEAQD